MNNEPGLGDLAGFVSTLFFVGVVLVEQVQIPKPMVLRPFRTFCEIEQPESKFIVRVRDRHGDFQIALFEADGGAWEMSAIHRIREYMEMHLPESVTLV